MHEARVRTDFAVAGYQHPKPIPNHEHVRHTKPNPHARCIGIDFGGDRIRAAAAIGVRVSDPSAIHDVPCGWFNSIENQLAIAPQTPGQLNLYFSKDALQQSVRQ